MKKLIHICGTGRSGSTVLDLIIGSLDNSISLGEINAYYYPYRKHHIQPICSCGTSNCSYLNNVISHSRENIHEKLLEQKDINNAVDSSKSLLWVYENSNNLNKKNIELYNLVIIKDFKSYAHSIWKRGGSIKLAFRKYTNYYNNLISSGIKFCLINQKDLLYNKQFVSQKIFDYTGLILKEENFDFWNFEQHYLFGSPSARKQITNKSKQKLVNFEKEFQKEFDYFINNDRKKALNNLNFKLICREFQGSNPTIRFKFWFYFKKMKTTLISYYIKNTTSQVI